MFLFFFLRTENHLAGHFGGLGRGLVVGCALRVWVGVLVFGRVAAAAPLVGVGAGAVALEGSDAGAGGGAGAGQTGHAGRGHWEEDERSVRRSEFAHNPLNLHHLTTKLIYTSKVPLLL